MNDHEKNFTEMINDTGKLVAIKKVEKINQLSSMAISARESNVLVNDVEFWKWLNRNFQPSGIFESNASMLEYISKGSGKEEWLLKQLQGKGYEWDYMTAQRGKFSKIFNSYDAGDVSNKIASDVTEKNFLTGKISEYQMKAYTSKTNPDLHNTTKDIKVVTNSEKVSNVKSKGYEVDTFQNSEQIKHLRDNRINQIKNGKVNSSYNIKNTSLMMTKAGIIGAVIGITTEAITSYKSWKNGDISDEEYLKEILKAGGDVGFTSAGTAGLMLPISSAITAAGLSTLITIPVGFVVAGAVNKIVAPIFARGEYKQILSEAKYYQALENLYDDMIVSMKNSSEHYLNFINGIKSQRNIHENMKSVSMNLNKNLEEIYNSI